MTSVMHINNERRTQNDMADTRRAFLKRTLAVGAAALIAPGLLAACNGEQQNGTGSQSSASTCEGGGIDAVTRRALNYVDESPHADKVCANCRFFTAPSDGEACGGCEIVSGPIAPAGYCTAWAAPG